MKILVKEKISKTGIEKMRTEGFDVEIGADWSREDMLKRIHEFDALIVRSGTIVDKEVIEEGVNLKVIGRAGIGIDNIDVDEATKRGIIVCNAPQSNIVSAAEHTIALMLALLRNIPQAHYTLKYEKKWERNKFTGVEAADKVLGIIGLGRVGALVASRAKGLGMKVIAYDPYVSQEKFQQLTIERAEKLRDLLRKADIISIHLPKTKETIGLLGDKEFQLMKDGVYIINTARGGIFSEDTLIKYLKEGKVAGAALDVFDKEPYLDGQLFEFDNVILTPHLGASTVEAQDKAGIMIAEQVIAALRGEFVPNAVNIPMVPPEVIESVRNYLETAEVLGKIAAQLYKDSVDSIEISYSGELASLDTKILDIAVLKGFFSKVVFEPVSYVNAPLLAKERGIHIRQVKNISATGAHPNEITVTMKDLIISGTSAPPQFNPRITRLYGYDVDITPSKYMLVIKNADRPGIIGKLGTLLGKQNINIAAMQSGRKEIGGTAVSVLNVDEVITDELLKEIKNIDGILEAQLVVL